MAVNHDVVIPPDGLAAILKSLRDVHQLLGCKHTITKVAGIVCARVSMRSAKFVRGKSAGISLDLLRPLAARRFVQHITGSCVVVYPHLVAEPSPQQRSGR